MKWIRKLNSCEKKKILRAFLTEAAKRKSIFLKNTYFSMRCSRSQNGTDLAKWGHKKQDVRNQIQANGCPNKFGTGV